MSGTTATSSDQALARLAAAPLPERVQHLLRAVHGAATQVLAPSLQLTLVQLERQLFALAEQARNGQVQADLYAQIRQLGKHAGGFPGAFLDELAEALAQLREPAPVAATAAVPTMTLVTDTDIDRDIVLNEIARRESHRARPQLQLLGQRFGVLAAQPALDAERLPVGPHALCRILRGCGERLGLNLEAQQQLYHAFERQVMERQVELLEQLNLLLEREGVLPGLVYTPYLPRPSAPRRGGETAGRAAAHDHDAAAADGAPAATGPAAAGTAFAGDTAAGDVVAATDMAPLHALLAAARQALASPVSGPGGTAPAPAAGPTGPWPAATAAQAVPGAALQAALARLQAQPPAPASDTRRSFADLRQALLAQLRSEHGTEAALSPRDNDTLDLLGMLYGQIQLELGDNPRTAPLLERLQLPLARAAVNDAAFFLRDQHPARELLNSVAEYGTTWLGDDDTDPVLLQKLGETVERVVSDYQGDEAVFATANRQVRGHLQAAIRKAEVAERRQVEAARGKERLQVAKQLARDSIDRLCAQGAPPPKFVRTLLHEAWSDVLTLTLLRQGEQSAAWRQQQDTTRRIGEITADTGGTPDPALRGQVESALLQVGYHDEEAAAIARRLSTPGGVDASTSRTEMAVMLRARTRLGEASDSPAVAPAPVAARAERTAAEESCYRHLRTLPFGTWFDFTVNQQGDTRRQRLSWYSLTTDNALFVNQRGQKVAEHSLDALARLMARGQLRLVADGSGRLIDRAWQATLRALRSLAGGPSVPAVESP
ncbi:DUF1631 family protein [Stenotrophomonas mori]|uniref:DUF1631 domain-containing protein n=1 Tax=Stenotrophomonas mori TaxID=2871096 RepID=A0ABT0SCS9_9GAMM|nr:DUF1631 family protein [Stenotrophomonas mori]MCL7713097.1 DUF1631 domain-containing protein [Stenotrophomonas mori]